MLTSQPNWSMQQLQYSNHRVCRRCRRCAARHPVTAPRELTYRFTYPKRSAFCVCIPPDTSVCDTTFEDETSVP